jgi:DUF2971 family protein
MDDQVEAACLAIRAVVDQQSESRCVEGIRAELFHYTPPEGFIGIISKRSLWASDMLSLSDASEVSYPQQVIVGAAENSNNIPGKCRERFNKQLTEYMFRMDAPYVACFCENSDLLSQWRGYSASGMGFAVGFGVPWLRSLKENGFRLQRVIYDRGQQMSLVLDFLRRVEEIILEGAFSEDDEVMIWQRAAAMLSTWVVMFKHPSFQEESEWRIVSEIERRTSVLTPAFRLSGQRIVPYVEIGIPSDMKMETVGGTAITRVVRGPYFKGTDARGARFMLAQRGFFIAGYQFGDSRIPLI